MSAAHAISQTVNDDSKTMNTLNPVRIRLRAVLLALCLPPVAAAAEPAPADQHQTYCVPCHQSALPNAPDALYTRPQRLVRSYAQIAPEVRKWATAAGLRWSDAEVANMAAYLNAQYYRY